jgi:hypothetical protein
MQTNRPTFSPVSVSEIGFAPGKNASSMRAFDDVEGRNVGGRGQRVVVFGFRTKVES